MIVLFNLVSLFMLVKDVHFELRLESKPPWTMYAPMRPKLVTWSRIISPLRTFFGPPSAIQAKSRL